jgi:hypothetical protein
MDFTDAITENTLRAIRFERPDHIPVVFWINPACWHHYRDLRELVPHRLFPNRFRAPGSWERAGRPYGCLGCGWETTDDITLGHRHPRSDGGEFHVAHPSNGMGPTTICRRDNIGRIETGRIQPEHGHTFCSNTRGYERLVCDMTDATALRRLSRNGETSGRSWTSNWASR